MDFRHHDFIRLGLIAGLAISLNGCGGSGGATPEEVAASPPEPVADGTGAEQETGTGSVPPPASEKVTVRGLVTDAPIVNARVSVTVGDQVFDAPLLSDASGAYEVEIESTDPDQLVYCQAVDQSGTVRFTAVPSTFGELNAAAESGAVGDMNITNVTTAHQVLVRQFLEDGQIQSVTQLRDMAQFVDTRRLLELSAAIKLVVEQREGIVLPAGIADSQALAEAIVSGQSTFVDDVQVSNPGAFDRALNDVVSDGHAVLAFSPASATGVYADAGSGDVLMLLEAGGYVNSPSQGLREISSWSVGEDGRLALQLADGSVSFLAALARSEDLLNAVVGSPDEAAEDYRMYSFRQFAGAFDAVGIAGTYALSDNAALVYILSEGGGGYLAEAATGNGVEDFSWQLDASGALVLSLSGRSIQLTLLDGSVRGRMWVVARYLDGTGELTDLQMLRMERSE